MKRMKYLGKLHQFYLQYKKHTISSPAFHMSMGKKCSILYFLCIGPHKKGKWTIFNIFCAGSAQSIHGNSHRFAPHIFHDARWNGLSQYVRQPTFLRRWGRRGWLCIRDNGNVIIFAVSHSLSWRGRAKASSSNFLVFDARNFHGFHANPFDESAYWFGCRGYWVSETECTTQEARNAGQQLFLCAHIILDFF